MSTINTNLASLYAQNALAQNQAAENTSLQRLSTGLKINSGADDPAGLIAANNLKATQAGITQAISNANRATNVIGTAEGGLNEVSSLLTQVQSLVSQTANSGGLSSEEIAANQSQVDSILTTVNRISGSTSFAGKQLLNGDLAYTTSSAGTSAFGSLQINAAHLSDNKTTAVVVQVTNSATHGQVAFAATNIATGKGYTTAAVTISVAGAGGTQQLSFAASTSLSSVAIAVNNVKDLTGVSAAVSGTHLNVDSSDFGSSKFVSVQAVSGTFTTTGGTSGVSKGTDAEVNINGAAATVDGTNVTYRNSNLDVSLTLSNALNAGKTKTFGITGGGATFALGATVNENDKASIGISSVNTSSLGDSTLGFLSSLATGGANSLTSGNLGTAQKILSEATNQVSELNGRLGAFQTNTLGATVASLNVAYENSASALSSVEDTNFASETANLTRTEILASAATTVLSQANSNPQSVLKLLG